MQDVPLVYLMKSQIPRIYAKTIDVHVISYVNIRILGRINQRNGFVIDMQINFIPLNYLAISKGVKRIHARAVGLKMILSKYVINTSKNV